MVRGVKCQYCLHLYVSRIIFLHCIISKSYLYFGFLLPSFSTTHLGENHVHHGDWQISSDIITLEGYKRVTVGKMTHVFMHYLSPS